MGKVVLVSGEDQHAIDAYIDGLKVKSKGYKSLWADESDINDLRNSAAEQSLFDDPTDTVVVKGLYSAGKDYLSATADVFGSDLPADVYFIWGKPDKRSRIYKAAKKAAAIEDFPLPSPGQMLSQAKKYAQDLGLSDVIARQVSSVSQTPAEAISALDLVSHYVRGSGHDPAKKLTANQLSSIIPPKTSDNIFGFLDQALSGDRDKPLRLYHELLQSNLEPSYIAVMVSWQMANIAGAGLAGRGSAKDLGMNPYVFDKSLRASSRLSRAQLGKLIDLALKFEKQLKTTTTDPRQLTEVLLARLAAI